MVSKPTRGRELGVANFFARIKHFPLVKDKTEHSIVLEI